MYILKVIINKCICGGDKQKQINKYLMWQTKIYIYPFNAVVEFVLLYISLLSLNLF